MEVHRSCIVSSNGPGLSAGVSGRVLQEQSGNRRRDSGAEGSQTYKHISNSPDENLYLQGSGSYFTGNITPLLQHGRSEEEIEREGLRIYHLALQCERFHKYRNGGKSENDRKKKDVKVWPERLEIAFFQALVRHPPMGKRKMMQNGRLRGRNELISIAIQIATGILRDRKQVSSHLQVLRPLLRRILDGEVGGPSEGCPEALLYMSTKDLSAKVSRHHNSHSGYMRRSNALGHGSSQTSKFDFNSHTGHYAWDTGGSPQKLLSLRSLTGLDTEPYFSLANFGMYVHVDNELVHYYTQLAERARVEDLIVNDVQPWHRQYPELAFHRTGDFKNCQVLVCDSSIQIMTEKLPRNAVLSVQCDIINSYLPLYDDLECRTRFYDAGKLADQFDDEGRITSQTSSRINYDKDMNGVQLKFGSNFWVHRMSVLTKHLRNARMLEENAARAKIDMDVRRRLQYLTAAQELYGTRRDTNQTECLLTILWRFRQTKSTDEAGQTNWRVVRFTSEQAHSVKAENLDLVEERNPLLDTTGPSTSMYLSLPLDFSHQSFSQHPHQLDLDSFSSFGVEGLSDFSNPQSASAPSMTTDFSTQSLPSLSHSQDTGMAHSQDYDPNSIDFTGGHINTCLEPAIDLGAYEGYAATNSTSMDALQSVDGLEHVHNSTEFDFSGLGVSLMPYAPKPWSHTDIIERLEGFVEQHPELSDHTSDQDIAGHGVLHHGQLDHGLWKLQSPFPEDTGLGADGRAKDDQLSQDQGHGLLNYGDRGEKFRLF